MIRFFAKGRCAHCVTDDKLTKGSVGIEVRFYLEDWDAAPNRVAVFKAGSVKVDVALLSDSCMVPPEVLANPGDMLVIGVYGTDNDGDIVIPTVYAEAGRVRLGTAPTGISPTPTTQPLIDQLVAAAEEAERVAQSVRDDADAGNFNGESAYQIAVDNGYVGTEQEWIASLHGQDAVVDATLSQAGEAADAAETGKVKHTADYALTFAETLNNGDGIPLDAEWLPGDVGGSRPYRIHSKRRVNTERKVLQAAAGYRFRLRIFSNDSYSDSNWYGPAYASRLTYTLPKGADYCLVVSTSPEDQTVTADPEAYGAQVTIQNNIGSGGGGGGTSNYNDLTNKPQINSVTLSGNKSLADLGIEPEALLVTVTDSVGGFSTDYGFTEIKAAADAGKRVSALFENCLYSLYTIDVPSSTAVFTSVYGNLSHIIVIVNQAVRYISTVYNYSKPSGGIPKTDLASAVQTSLGKADTALQSYTETDPTVPSWAKQPSKPSYAASEVGAVAADQGVANANKVLKVNSSGVVVPDDNRFVVTLTPTALDFSGVMDKTVAEIDAAYKAGKLVIFRIMTGANSYAETNCTAVIDSGLTYPSYGGYIIDPNNNILIYAWSSWTDNGGLQVYSTTIYPLATGQWTGGSY